MPDLSFNALQTIDVSDSNISLTNVGRMLTHANNLQTLDLSRCENLADGDLPDLSHNCQNLTKLLLVGSSISIANLEALLNTLPALKTLDLRALQFSEKLTYDCAEQNKILGDILQPLKEKNISILGFPVSQKPTQSKMRAKSVQATVAHNQSTECASQKPDGASKPYDCSKNENYQSARDTPFQYEHIINYSQTMLKNQLSQYLTLTQQDCHIIPEIKDGFCGILSEFCREYLKNRSLYDWQAYLKSIQNWDGKITPTHLVLAAFERLRNAVATRLAETATAAQRTYIEINDDLEKFLANDCCKEGAILFNAWHAILVKKGGAGLAGWIVYDPNNKMGGLRCYTFKAVSNSIREALGTQITIEYAPTKQVLPISLSAQFNPDDFIKSGGLLMLARGISNADMLLDRLKKQQIKSTPQDDAIRGIRLQDLNSTPAWLAALQSRSERIQRYTVFLLKQFIQSHSDWIQQLPQSLETALDGKHHAGFALRDTISLLRGLNKSTKYDDIQKLCDTLEKLNKAFRAQYPTNPLPDTTPKAPNPLPNEDDKENQARNQLLSVPAVKQPLPNTLPAQPIHAPILASPILTSTVPKIHTVEMKAQKTRLVTRTIPSPGTRSLKEIAEPYLAILDAKQTTPKHYECALILCEDLVTGKLAQQANPNINIETFTTQLVNVGTDKAVQDLILNLQYYCQHTERQYFYIDSPDDLHCPSASLKKDEHNHGTIVKGRSGALYDFLTKEPLAEPRTLIVNYNHFDNDDIVRFNTLLDKIRLIDSVPVPDACCIIGIRNEKKPDCYQGADFISRFKSISTFSPENGALLHHFAEQNVCSPFVDVLPQHQDAKPIVIDLFCIPYWQTRLFGQWMMQEGRLIFKPGDFVKALQDNQPILLKNPPKDDGSFDIFFREAKLRKYIEYAGDRIAFPDTVCIKQESGYDWMLLKTSLQCTKTLDYAAYPLNPGQLGTFFQQQAFNDETHTLNLTPGILEAHPGSNLSLCLTRALAEDEWARLLDKAKTLGCTLTVSVMPGVEIPETLQEILSSVPANTLPLTTSLMRFNTTVIVADDPDMVIENIYRQKKPIIIDVTGLNAYDLLENITTQYDIDSDLPSLTFYREPQVLLTLLENPTQQVALKGHFSNELLDALAPLLLKRLHSERELDRSTEAKDKPLSSQLLLLPDSDSSFNYVPKHTLIDDLTKVETKKTLLRQRYTATKNQAAITVINNESNPTKYQWEKESLAVLDARIRYKLAFPNQSTDLAWKGLEKISPTSLVTAMKNQDDATAFDAKRLATVNAMLKQAPYLFIAGLTGVGKSTFIEEHIVDSAERRVYSKSTEALIKWAEGRDNKEHVFIFDEANFKSSFINYSAFEGLYNDPPDIVIDGKHYLLTDKHKIIFMGNPVDYGEGRGISSLFEAHGNVIVFDPLPKNFVRERVLKPVFGGNQEIDPQAYEPFLAVYQWLCEWSTQFVLISPRELQMMALLTRLYLDEHKDAHPHTVAAFYAKQITAPLVPTDKVAVFNDKFTAQFPAHTLNRNPITLKDNCFHITASREAAARQLNDLLDLCEKRQKAQAEQEKQEEQRKAMQPEEQHKDQPNEKTKQDQYIINAQQYGGTGAIIFEGPSGIGKSELAIALLRAHGYEQQNWEQKTTKTKPFYQLPATLSPQEQEVLLLRAFDEGACIIIDECNSVPLPEKLLNDLLRGKHPTRLENDGRPKKPGFLLIGTQNPASTFAGRRQPSAALARRALKVMVSAYTHSEHLEILNARGLNKSIAEIFVTRHEANITKASNEQRTPPTVRQLITATDEYLKTHSKTETIDEVYEEETEQQVVVEQSEKNNSFQAQPFATKTSLIALLDQYIKRIESHTIDNKSEKSGLFQSRSQSTNNAEKVIHFAHGFIPLFSSWRAKNRKANYELAKTLRGELKDIREELNDRNNLITNILSESHIQQLRKDSPNCHLSKTARFKTSDLYTIMTAGRAAATNNKSIDTAKIMAKFAK
ncbi:MAG: hypothetical protein A3F43_06640 [Gammaproteobacteria bacterium RIFCSPHIGHO2_12_FULL_42_10]|nr:MAG: hypothetical protein A3F43_06640 [Gammaproteobacteria bacterium RIFCSPHIGHO2_12_FULL_42_10]